MNWADIISEATMKSFAQLPKEDQDDLSLILVQPPATEGLRKWAVLVGQA